MKNKKLLLVFVAVNLLALGASCVCLYGSAFHLCRNTDSSCYDLSIGVGRPLLYWVLATLPFMILQLFLPDTFFRVWKYFFLAGLLIVIRIAASTPTVCRGWFCSDRYQNVQFVSILFVWGSIALLMIIGLSMLLRRTFMTD